MKNPLMLRFVIIHSASLVMEIRIENLNEMVIINIVMYFLSYFLYVKRFIKI